MDSTGLRRLAYSLMQMSLHSAQKHASDLLRRESWDLSKKADRIEKQEPKHWLPAGFNRLKT